MAKRSKSYRVMAEKIDVDRGYTVEEAVKELKKVLRSKFDESVDLVLKLDIDPRQADQLVRGSISLPHGTGKSVRVLVFAEGAQAEEAQAAGAQDVGSEDLVEKIKKGYLDFDVAIAHPSMMRHVGKLGRLLGPKGLMPSPKSGTVTPNVGQAVNEFKAGKIEFRNDEYGNVHAGVGKMSFAEEQIMENVTTFIKHIVNNRPASVKGTFVDRVFLSSTMGPGLRIVSW